MSSKATLTSKEWSPKQLAACLRALAQGYHVDSGAIEVLNTAALIVEKAPNTPETGVRRALQTSSWSKRDGGNDY